MNIGFISLGCSKNLIDTEMAIGFFKQNNFKIVNDINQAEIIVINTCGFIESAKQEAINTILEMANYKQTGICKFIIVMGCLVQRYKKDLEKSLPEVDLFISINEYSHFGELVTNLLEKSFSKNCFDYPDRIISTGNTTAYLKIAEGCSNRCTYCAIPYIRGPYISRPFEDIIEEAKVLSKKGFKEIIVIAQDTTKYGLDLYGKLRLTELLQELCKINKFEWIRFLYAYPESITDELINVVKSNDKICNYFDIPIQHISDKILKLMNRKSNSNSITNLLKNIKLQIPDVIFRTSLIVGFPSETEEDFNNLYSFIEQSRFNKLGTFIYSKEDGTPAAKLSSQIHLSTKKKRFNKIMGLQKEISNKNLSNLIGKDFKVLLEGKTFDNNYYVGRTYMEAPDTDGVTYIKNTKELKIGSFVNCKIINFNEYDLIGELI